MAGQSASPRAGPLQRVVVVCSPGAPDEQTLKAADTVAQAQGGTITLLDIVEPPSEIDRIAAATGLSPPAIEERLVAERHERLSELVSKISPDSQPAIDVRVGKAFIEIIRYVIAHDVDLIVKAAEEADGLSRYLFTSTDQHLLRKCPCPVWLRPPGSAEAVRTVLAAVDVDDSLASEPQTLRGLNERIIETVAQLAGEQAIDAHILHVWDAPGEDLVRIWSDTPDPNRMAQDYVGDVQSRHWHALESLVGQATELVDPDRLSKVRLLPMLKRGSPRKVIAAQAAKLKPDVLVMGTIARTGVPGFIIGNTAEDILNSVDCSVLTVKPPDYESPIKPAEAD